MRITPGLPARGSVGVKRPLDRTVAVTVGGYGGFYVYGGKHCWRVCLGWIAFTYLRAEFTQVLDAWLSTPETP